MIHYNILKGGLEIFNHRLGWILVRKRRDMNTGRFMKAERKILFDNNKVLEGSNLQTEKLKDQLGVTLS